MNAWLQNKTMWNLVSKTVDWSPTALRSSTSHSPETLKSKSSNLDLTSTGKPVARDSNENAASTSQMRQSDVNLSVSARNLRQKRQRIPLVQGCLTTKRQCHRTTSAILRNSMSNVRQKLGRQSGHDTLEIDVNMMICRKCVSATMKATVHLGQKDQKNLNLPPRTRTSTRSVLVFICDFTEIGQGSRPRKTWNIFSLIGIQFHG